MPPAVKSDLGPFNYVQGWKNLREETDWRHSFELPHGTEIRGVCLLDVLKNTAELVGRFDSVLFLGVLYHLKYPLPALPASRRVFNQ